MPRLLLLYHGPASLRRTLVERHGARLRDEGISLAVADDFLVDSDGALFERTLRLPPPERVGDALEALRTFAREHPIDGILAQSEAAMLPGAILARDLGLPAIPVESAHLCANKALGREALRAAGVPCPRFAVVRDAASVRRFAAGRYPIILKGAASTMSRLVTKVDSEAAVGPAIERMRAGIAGSRDIERLRSFCAAARLDPGLDPLAEFLAESHSVGVPVETDGIALERPLTYGVTEQILSTPPLFYIEGYLLPSTLPGAEAVSDAALRALGVRSTGFSIEMRARDGSAEVIEVNGRLGEDDGFFDLFREATGRAPFLDAVAVALGRRLDAGGRGGAERSGVLPERSEGRGGAACAIAYRSWYEGGVVARVPTPADLVPSDPAIVRIGLSTYAGERLRPAPHPDCFPHVAWALARHPSSSREAHAAARRAVDALPFTIAP